MHGGLWHHRPASACLPELALLLLPTWNTKGQHGQSPKTSHRRGGRRKASHGCWIRRELPSSTQSCCTEVTGLWLKVRMAHGTWRMSLFGQWILRELQRIMPRGNSVFCRKVGLTSVFTTQFRCLTLLLQKTCCENTPASPLLSSTPHRTTFTAASWLAKRKK